eukprot:GFUD01081785.1.p1 GENE.GFUD01081785.1~~GFUD01081785.1.p1  ORF type:complete len:160 (+),score=61.49 GFUD01081785.1:108-587(+)
MAEPHKKARANPVYITPVLRRVSNSDSSDELPEGDTEYKPSSKKKRQRKRKIKAVDNQDDEEIAVLEEKINPKTKMMLMQKKKERKGPTNSVQEMLKRLAAFAKSANTTNSADEESEDDSYLTCSVCLTSFWYSRHLQEHMRTEHGADSQETVGKDGTE